MTWQNSDLNYLHGTKTKANTKVIKVKAAALNQQFKMYLVLSIEPPTIYLCCVDLSIDHPVGLEDNVSS